MENIGPRERRKRLILGLAMGLSGAVLEGYAVSVGAFTLVLVSAGLLLGGAIAFFEAADRTCVLLAAMGARNLDDGYTPVPPEHDRREMRRRASLVYLKATVVALTAALPGVALTWRP